jgi:YD repeat-containing protein
MAQTPSPHDIWIMQRPGWGWIAWESCTGRPWNVLPQEQADFPPEGDWHRSARAGHDHELRPATGNLLSVVADAGTAPHLNARSSFAYNSVGQVVIASDPIATTTRHGCGNLTSVVPDFGGHSLNQDTTMAYGAAGDVTSTTDPNGHVTTRTYDADRRLMTVISPGSLAAPNGTVTRFHYDADVCKYAASPLAPALAVYRAAIGALLQFQ